VLDTLGGPPIAAAAALEEPDADGWLAVADRSEVPAGGSTVIYAGGKQVALFNLGGTIYALSNRCSHARGPLSEGHLDSAECTVVCPWHYAKFDLKSGQVLDGVAQTSVSRYEVEIRDETIYLREVRPEPVGAD